MEQFREGNYWSAAGQLALGTLGVAGGARAGLNGMKGLTGRYDPLSGRKLKPGEANTYCLPAGMPLVLADGGSRVVEEVRVGDRLLSRDEGMPGCDNAQGLVVSTFMGVSMLWSVRVNGQMIEATGGHAFYTVERGWVSVHELRVGEHLQGTTIGRSG